jgi:hypothetical protein
MPLPAPYTQLPQFNPLPSTAMRNFILVCFGVMLAQQCLAQSAGPADEDAESTDTAIQNAPAPDTLLFQGGEELIDLYHALPGAASPSSNPKLVEALAAARNGDFRSAALRASRSKDAFERRDEASLIVEKYKQNQFTTSGAKFVAVVSDITLQSDPQGGRRLRICWERTCRHDRPVLEERVANYILHVSLPSPQGVEIEPDEAAARALEAEASGNSLRILHATYIAEIEGADPVQTFGGLPFFQVRARLVKLRIGAGNALDEDAPPEAVYRAPTIFEAKF